jgi:hypothetical protein
MLYHVAPTPTPLPTAAADAYANGREPLPDAKYWFTPPTELPATRPGDVCCCCAALVAAYDELYGLYCTYGFDEPYGAPVTLDGDA